MRRLRKKQLPVVMVLLVSVLGLVVVSNSHLVYGGYDGLLQMSVARMMLVNQVGVNGRIGIVGDDVEDLKLNLYYEGHLEPRAHNARIQAYTMFGEQISSDPIGLVVITDGECVVKSELISEELIIPLEDGLGALSEKTQYKEVEEVIKGFVESAHVESVIIEDPRDGYKHLNRRVIAYELSKETLQLTVYVDESAMLMNMDLLFKIDEVTVDASMVFKYDVYGG